MGADREAWAKVEFAEALGAEALLLGRRSDEYFGSRWASRHGDWADRLNDLPKHVVSTTLVVDTRTVGDGLAYLIYEPPETPSWRRPAPAFQGARMPTRRRAGIRVLPGSHVWQWPG